MTSTRTLVSTPQRAIGGRTGSRGDLGPLGQLTAGRLPRRLVQLYVGLVLYGTSMTMMIRSTLGLDPWDVLHYGLTRHIPLSFGQVVIAAGVVVLLLWVPLRQRPGLGTISNVVVIGLVTDATLAVVSEPEGLAARVALLVGGVLMNGVATASYVGAGLGPGPRDGLMTGLVRVSGRSVRLVRTSIEVSVLAVGWLLGGIVGVGTVLYALAIGPLVHLMLPWFTVAPVRQANTGLSAGRISDGTADFASFPPGILDGNGAEQAVTSAFPAAPAAQALSGRVSSRTRRRSFRPSPRVPAGCAPGE